MKVIKNARKNFLLSDFIYFFKKYPVITPLTEPRIKPEKEAVIIFISKIFSILYKKRSQFQKLSRLM